MSQKPARGGKAPAKGKKGQSGGKKVEDDREETLQAVVRLSAERRRGGEIERGKMN